jgi:hypothetical protein
MQRIKNLEMLAAQIRAITEKHDGSSLLLRAEQSRDVMPTGWDDIDIALRGGLPHGLHEWFGLDSKQGQHEWTPPLCLLSHIAWQAFHHCSLSPWMAWIGRACHPYPRILLRNEGNDFRLVQHSLFVAAPNAAARLWAAEVAIHSSAIGCVIADGNGFNTAATRRLQLLAREQAKWILLARSPAQRILLSAAQTRWHLSVALSTKTCMQMQPRWSAELLRCKGVRPNRESPTWLLEWNGDEGAVHLSSGLADLACPAPKQVVRQHAG